MSSKASLCLAYRHRIAEELLEKFNASLELVQESYPVTKDGITGGDLLGKVFGNGSPTLHLIVDATQIELEGERR